MKLLEQKTLSKDSTLLERKKSERVRLNHATTHHHPPPPTNSQNISTTNHHHPPPAKIYSPSPTTTHHQPKYIHHYLQLPKKWTTHPRKSQNIFIYISFWHCCNSFLFLEMKYSFPSWRFCVAKF